MDIKNIVRNELKKYAKTDLERRLEEVRVPCMNYLKENALRIFKEKITEVYKINHDRIQVIDLPLFLKTVKTIDIDKWSFKVFIDEDLLNFKTKSGEQIYQYSNNGLFMDGYGDEATNLSEYWHTPISSQKENDWYKQEFTDEFIKFIKKDFIEFVKVKFGGK